MRSCFMALLVLLLAASPCVGGNTITVWDEDDNSTKASEMRVPDQDPAMSLKVMRETEQTRLELAIAKASRNLVQIQEPERRLRARLIVEEMERRLALLKKNPNKYFAKYPYKRPAPK